MNKMFVVATPIGNKNDFSSRAIDTLKNVGVIFAEDTSHSVKFLRENNIDTKLISLHKFNEKSRISEVLSHVEQYDVALISDAGTPTISDPGQLLIKELLDKKIKVVSVPGPSAIPAALSISGVEFNSFKFIGFLPKKEKQINDILEQNENEILVAYESPNRIKQTLKYIEKYNNEIQLTIVREISKMFEETIKGTAKELLLKEYKGEIVLIIENVLIKDKTTEITNKIDALKKEGMSDRGIINYLTKFEDVKKNEIYEELK